MLGIEIQLLSQPTSVADILMTLISVSGAAKSRIRKLTASFFKTSLLRSLQSEEFYPASISRLEMKYHHPIGS